MLSHCPLKHGLRHLTQEVFAGEVFTAADIANAAFQLELSGLYLFGS